MLLMLMLSARGVAQVVIGDADYDIDYLTPKEYEIGGITFVGAENYDTRMILLVAGLQVGDEILVPSDKLATAVDRLWKQGLFEDVQIYVTRIQDDKIFFEIELKSRPKLSRFSLKGAKKSEDTKLKEEMKIAAGDVVTENLLTTSKNRIRAYYLDKGYTNVTVDTHVEPDTLLDTKEGRVLVDFLIKPGKRVKIDQHHKAESDLAVAIASVIARAEFIRDIQKMCEEVDTSLTRDRNVASPLFRCQVRRAGSK